MKNINKPIQSKSITKRTVMKVLVIALILSTVMASTLSFAFADSSESSSTSDQTSSSQDAPSGSQPPEPPDGNGPPQGTPPGDPPSGDSNGNPPEPPSGDSNGNPPEPPSGNPGENSSGEAPSGGPGGTPPGGAPGEQSANISYTGATEFTEDTTESGQPYSSTESNQQALLVTGGTSTVEKATVTKTGDSDGDDSDFYGNNAAILAKDATLNVKDSEISTDGAHANAVFAYGDGVINISDSTITTTSNNSGGIMVTGGGTITADDLTVTTSGNSSALIRSDRGGGTITVNGGVYESNGTGSPVIYSTADITVNNAKMISNASEGVVVEGKNSITLNGVDLTADNNTLNGQSETYKAIFLYQSMSGDADEGTASFNAKDSVIRVLNGDTIYVTNTTANITLENNEIINESGDLMRIEAAAWGNQGSNGGNVTAVLNDQKAEGNVIVDSVSTLDLTLNGGSELIGAIDSENQAQQVDLTMSADSVLVLTADTYVDSLTNEASDNSNIYLNGHKLFVNGVETAANEGEYAGTGESYSNESATENAEDTANTQTSTNQALVYTLGGLAIVALVIVAVAVSKKKPSEHEYVKSDETVEKAEEPKNDDDEQI